MQFDALTPSPLSQFDTVKVVIFKEVAPLSDKFEQIVLTESQFKEVLRTLTSVMPPDGRVCTCGQVHADGFVVVTDDEHQYTFPNIRQMYPREEVAKMMQDDK